MEQGVDLHMHSNVSIDGELAPEELVRRCAAAGLSTVALTDHNSVRGVAQAKLASRLHGVQLISGIELDCSLGGQGLHLLGYGVDETRTVFADLEENILRQERHAGGLRIELIRKCGIQIDGAWLCSHANNGVITGELIAEAALRDNENINNPLIEPYQPDGWRSDNPYLNFYWDYCAPGRPAYVPIRYITAEEAIRIIHACGGAAVLAHPGAGRGCGEKVVAKLEEMGLDGIEVYSNYHTAQQTVFYSKQAQSHGLLETCGSDFHGKTKPAILLGEPLCSNAEELADMLMERIQKTTGMLLSSKAHV